MNQDSADNLIEIHDPEITASEIMAQIRARIEQRRNELGPARRVFPSFGGTQYPGEPHDLPYDANLYHHLRLANETYPNVETDPQLLATRATQIPIFGALWRRARAYIHRAILFYVNRTIAHQVEVDRHLVSVLNQLTAQNQAQQQQIDALRAEIDKLRNPEVE